MKIRFTTATLVLAALPVAAQTARTGVSIPDNTVITSNDDSVQESTQPAAAPSGRRPLTAATPSPATPAAPAAAQTNEVYGPYVPYKAPGAPTAPTSVAVAVPVSPDGEIVTSVPESDNEFREGTLIHVRIRENLSTLTTVPGTMFSAEVMEPLEKNGRVVIPIGSILNGQVTEVRSGKRISGAAALHLEPRDITLPDGTTQYILHAQLTDTSMSEFKVGTEGTLKRREDVKKNIAVASLATGGGAAAGALLGGGVGAVVGAGVGAGVSTYMWLKADRQATLPKDVRLVFSLTAPMELTPLKATSRPATATAGGTE